MFKRILDTSVNLTRIGIDAVTKVVSSVVDQPQQPPAKSTEPTETPSQETTSKKTTVNGLKSNLLRQANFKHDKILLEESPNRTKVHKFRVPDLSFTAVGSNKNIDLRGIRQSAVLFISHRENANEAADLNWQLIKSYLGKRIPFFTANIIILNEFPSFTHPVVKRELRKAYNDIVKDYVQDRKLAENIVHLLPDWKGASLKGFRIAQRRPVLASVILTPYGNVQRVIESANPLATIQHELVMQTK